MRKVSLVTGLILISFFAKAQNINPPLQRSTDTTSIIQIINADTLRALQGNDSNNITILKGNVIMRQGNTTFSCDSAIKNNFTNIIDAYGNIHINQNDSVQTYGDYLHYIGNEKKATLQKNVRLTDGKMVLTTQQLDYDLNTKIGIYSNGGKLVNDATVLTSETGYYYAATKDAYFKQNVVLTDPQYTLHTDTLLYNTATHTATFVAPTTIQNGKTTSYTSSGFYNTETGKGVFANRSVIVDSAQTITADSMFYNKATGIGTAKGNVVWTDTSRKILVLSNYARTNENTHTLLATQKPLLIYQMEKDTLFVAGDTLFSGLQAQKKIIDSNKISVDSTLQRTHQNMLDSSKINIDAVHAMKKNLLPAKDSVITALQDSMAMPAGSNGVRYFIAYHNVKIYSDSLQGVADSLYYSFADSTFRLYKNPVVWIGINQLKADTIKLFTKNQKASKLELLNNAIIINKVGDNFFNQIKGTTIYGYFKDNQLSWMHVNGNAESIYYVRDDDGKFIGVNRATSAIIDIYLENKELNKVVFRDHVESTLDPIQHINPRDYQLKNFKWEASRRPESKFELMQ